MYDANTHYLLMARRQRRRVELTGPMPSGGNDERASVPIAPEMAKKAEAKMVSRTDRILRAYGGTGPRHTVMGREEPRSYEPETV